MSMVRTLDNLFDNTQDLFNHVCEHLMRQGKRSANSSVGCAYRGANGLACAVGACIPDEYYSDEFEGIGVDMLPEQQVPSWIRDNIRLLNDLQMIHDTNDPSIWPMMLRKTAHNFLLTEPKCIR